ncbi:HAMP domain-containing histidine kinase [Sulfurimonas sp. SAG-AH-194-I05]|nr:HAMP domain-containing sensor histidine kinase [Sulfurimonas sp. SAG-AH-194-I05]MDF1875484.1 HAMP domain-containing histidine kinase [Sulfurimonas sp. SAG-AH-194-I05]
MLKDKIPTLILVCEELYAQEEAILEYWVHTNTVINVLTKHNIDMNVFKNDYAVKILDYYFGVVNQTKEIGDCPVMAAFLEMLKEHDISADELFDICTHARKSMISVAFDMGIASKELFRDISYVFDLNFKGVLQQYSNTIYKLEKQIEVELQENRKKDAVMFQQARLAQMGEMISNIAHQWRQPIAMISAIVQNTHMKYTLGKLESEFFNKSTDDVKKLLSQMSSTISDFQNFFQPNKEKAKFCVENSITETLDLIDFDLKKANIQLVRFPYVAGENVLGYPNEFAQTILNLFSNAKDALIENNEVQNRYIHVRSSVDNGRVTITIHDNAGGIPENILDKIFNPYFTTKEEGKGTGIGLYMSHQIIEKNMDGRLCATNETILENQVGAMFTISLKKC